MVTLLERLGVRGGLPRGPDLLRAAAVQHRATGTRPSRWSRRYAAAFEGYDYIVDPSGSCAAMVRDNYPRIGAKAAAEGRATELAGDGGAVVPGRTN